MAPYGIAVDKQRRILRVTLHGFWDMAIVAGYMADLRVAAEQVSRGGAPSWWLIDLKDSQVQSREVAEFMRDKLPALFPPAATVAVVAQASLSAVQAKRVVPNEHHRHFTNLVDAERWLTDQGMPG